METGTESYVIGCRDSEDSSFGKMLFIIALGDPTQQLNEWSLRRRQDRRDVLTGLNHSSASGLWWGMASSVHTAMRVSRGQVQFEREEV